MIETRAEWLALRRRCYRIYQPAVRDGKLERPEHCSKCGAAGRIEGHHDDYSKPLDVRWLCRPCHCKIPRKYFKEPRPEPKSPPETPKIITPGEAARILGVSKTELKALAGKAFGYYRYNSRTCRYDQDEIVAYLGRKPRAVSHG
jgi:hypothetical protein